MNYSINDLIIASKNGNKKLIKKIIDSGLNINSQDELGFTSLHEVVEFGYHDLFWFLIKKGAQINSKTNDNFSLLHASAIGGNKKIIKYLIDNGLNINETTKGEDKQAGWSALHYSVLTNNIENIKYLINIGINREIRSKQNMTALDLAIKLNHKKIIKLLK